MAIFKGRDFRGVHNTNEHQWDMARLSPPPQFVVLTDRADGTEWFISYSDGYISINDTMPEVFASEVIRYPAYEGPILNRTGRTDNLRLLIRDGYLGYEETGYPNRVQSQRVFGRIRVRRTYYEIIVPDTYGVDDLAWETSP